MVGSRNPQRIVALHSLVTDQDILQGIVQCVSHVQLSCDIGRRHDNRERFFTPIHLCMEILFLQPLSVNTILHCFGIVGLCQLFHSVPPSFFFRFLNQSKKISALSYPERALVRGTTLLYEATLPLHISHPLTLVGREWLIKPPFTIPAPKLPSAGDPSTTASQPMSCPLF